MLYKVPRINPFQPSVLNMNEQSSICQLLLNRTYTGFEDLILFSYFLNKYVILFHCFSIYFNSLCFFSITLLFELPGLCCLRKRANALLKQQHTLHTQQAFSTYFCKEYCPLTACWCFSLIYFFFPWGQILQRIKAEFRTKHPTSGIQKLQQFPHPSIC